MRFMRNVNDGQVHINNGNVSAEDFFTAHEVHNADQLVEKAAATAAAPDWARDFEMGKQGECKFSAFSANHEYRELCSYV